MSDKFINGSQWVRFDCHLHTNSDKEFKYNEDETEYIGSYVNKLKEDIVIWIIFHRMSLKKDIMKSLSKSRFLLD
jgi:hypothetical protein